MLERLYGQQDVGGAENRIAAVGPFDLLVKRIGKLRTRARAALEQHAHVAAASLSAISGTRLTRVSPGARSRSAPIVTGISFSSYVAAAGTWHAAPGMRRAFSTRP